MPLRVTQLSGGRLSLLFLLLLTGCHLPVESDRPRLADSKPVARELPALTDDGDKASLSQALAASIGYWQGQPPERRLLLCGKTLAPADLLATLREFQGLQSRLPPHELAAAVETRFDVCQVNSGQGQGDLLVTGYYQPRFTASLVRQPPFIHPVYRLPADLLQAQVFTKAVSQEVGRVEKGQFVPYWTRAEIETGNKLRGEELCYLADPVEAFILQVQGSGLVELPDGQVRQLLFAGTNGRPYRSIGRLLVDEGRIPLSEIDLPAIRRYLHEHLDERERILHYNERYVFFKFADARADRGPVGSMGAALTPGRSVALDLERFPVGGLYYLITERPPETGDTKGAWLPMTRFVLHQDTGAAIKGPGRLDFFWGSGEYPERAAGLMKQQGRLYVLIKKNLGR